MFIIEFLLNEKEIVVYVIIAFSIYLCLKFYISWFKSTLLIRNYSLEKTKVRRVSQK